MIYCYPTWFDCIDGAAKAAAQKAQGLKGKILLFTEDELTLTAETALVKQTGGTFGAEVTSFGRYIQKHSSGSESLSKEGAAMAVKKILASLSDELIAFKSVSSSPSFAGELSELIAQLKSAKVTPDSLDIGATAFTSDIYAKVHDVRLVFKEYEKFLSDNGLTDSSNSLSEVPSLVEKDETVKQTHVIFVGYSSVTRSSIDAVKAFYESALSCDFFCVEKPDSELYTREFFNFAKSLSGDEPIYPETSACDEAKRLLNALYEPASFSKVGLYSDKVSIFEAKNVLDECDYIASRIRYEVLENGLRYEDIAIGLGGTDDYRLTLKKKLSDYSVPFFLDEKKTLASHPALKLIECALKNSERRGDIEEIKKMISNGIFISDKEKADEMTALIIKNSVTAKTFLSGNELSFDLYLTPKYEAIRRLFRDLKPVDKTENYVAAINSFLTYSGTYENAKVLSERLVNFSGDVAAAFCEAGMKKLGEVLSETQGILCGETMTISEFKKILLSGAEAAEISLIPAVNLDCVYVSELKDCRYKKHKILFAAGLNANVPAVKEDVAILRDGDIKKLDELSVKIEPKIRTVNKREREANAIALLSFEKNLYVSYCVSGRETESKSELIDYITAAFSDSEKTLKPFNRLSLEKAKKYATKERKNRIAAYDFMAVRPALFSLVRQCDDFKNGASDDITSASSFYRALKKYDGNYLTIADRLLGKMNEELVVKCDVLSENYFSHGNVSASILETYYSCPYKNFMKYGVGLSDYLTSEPRSLDYGNILHSVAEQFANVLNEINSESEAESAARKIYAEITEKEQYRKFLQRADYARATELVEGEAVKLCKKLYNEYKNSEFIPIGAEIWFSDWGEYKSLPLKTKKSGYKLFGKADRVDKFVDKNGETYIRIIDYKTGSVDKKVKEESFYTGNNLQLYLYMNAFTQKGEKPAGAYYYEINDDFTAEGERPVSMRGKTILSEEIFGATDKNINAEKKSDVIAVKYSALKKGEKITGDVADDSTFNAYMAYALKMAENGVDDITDGIIISSPYQKACDYCDYKGLCRHDDTCDRTRKANNVTKDTILSAMGVENGK